ncbi:MAG: ABC transporter ATP-binding protein [Treponema sp.]|nr:ABC transporter ATP-binding protein [Treponema sp.]
METLLNVKNLSIGINRFGKLLSSVEDISFEIYGGEILGLVGESGSGKSLTALSIPGLLDDNKEVTGGSIIFDQRNLLSLSEGEMQKIRGKEISMIFQEPFSSLNPLMRVGDQIAETLELHGEKNRAALKCRLGELMERLKLPEPEKLAKAYPHQLSGGMCQRVMIALAVICRPRLLIADEPTTALDHNTQDEIISLLKEINRDFGTSVLFISHDLSLVKKLCSRVLVMYSGRLLEEGESGELFSNPAHEYTRSLLASIPQGGKRGKALFTIPGRIPSLEEGRPSGCPFHPRCAKSSPKCMEEFPEEIIISSKHRTRCLCASVPRIEDSMREELYE